ncbi:MAG: MgtC/SapB family protein [Treponema sp.]|jgi:putative Mg2+ transporter-C (MgtC) family protein|nr:MgtC/SapB family protein [Treponema sp.]
MNTVITEFDIVIRLGMGFIAGGIIGFERSSRRQVAGLRTHILIALGATCLMMLSVWIPQKFTSGTGDPGRIAAQVVSGMGFLGAGAIIRLGSNIKGLTTASSLWLVAAIGMSIGAGMYAAALVAEILSLITLMLLNPLERKFFPEVQNKLLELYYNRSVEPDTEAALEILKNFGIESHSLNVNLAKGKRKNNKARFLVSIPDMVDISKLAKALKSSGNIIRLEIKERI